jgi:F0F1-type ATP synthase assembly protein I
LVAIDLPNARRLGYSVVLGQAIVTGIVALMSFAMAGSLGGWSALLGGGISTLASLCLALIAFGRSGANAQSAITAFYVGETAKLVVAVVLFVLILKTMRVAPLPLFTGYMATFLVYWMILARAVRNPNGSK